MAHQVNEYERQDIGAEDLKHLITRHGTGLNAVDNEGHHIGIGKRQQKDVAADENTERKTISGCVRVTPQNRCSVRRTVERFSGLVFL
mgnify:CR=1 FL=1